MYTGISQSYHNYSCGLNMFHTSETITHFDTHSPDSTTPHHTTHTTPYHIHLNKHTHKYTYTHTHTYIYIYTHINMYVFSLMNHVFSKVIMVSFRRNFLELNVYMRDLRVKEYEQLEAYTIIDLLSKANLCYCVYKIRRKT